MMGPSEQFNEEQARLRAARSGDQRAFRILYDLHVEPLFRFLQQFGTTRSEVQDWVQRTFIKAFTRLDQFDGRSSFSTWLFRIGFNEMAADRRKTHVFDLDKGLEDFDELPDGPGDEFLWERTMYEWLNTLDALKRSVFILHEVEGFSHSEIADILDITESHSRTILARVRHFLKDQWKKEHATR